MTSAIGSRVSRALVVCALSVVPTLLWAASAHGAAGPLSGLHATVTLDKDVYHVGDTANVTITLSSAGSVTFTGITAMCNRVGDQNQLNSTGPTWGTLASDGAGVSVPAGHTVTFHVSTTIPPAAQRIGDYIAACDFGHKNVDEPDRPEASDMAFVPGGHGAVIVHANTDSSGSPGPAVPGVGLAIVHTNDCPYLARGTTNSAGTFTFTNLPPGTYNLYVYPPAGSKVVPPQNPTPFQVQGGSTSGVFISLTSGTAAVPATPPTPTVNCDTWVPPSDSAVTSNPTLAETGFHAALPLAIGLSLLVTGIGLSAVGVRRRGA